MSGLSWEAAAPYQYVGIWNGTHVRCQKPLVYGFRVRVWLSNHRDGTRIPRLPFSTVKVICHIVICFAPVVSDNRVITDILGLEETSAICNRIPLFHR